MANETDEPVVIGSYRFESEGDYQAFSDRFRRTLYMLASERMVDGKPIPSETSEMINRFFEEDPEQEAVFGRVHREVVQARDRMFPHR